MSGVKSSEVVKSIYAAFQRGDIEAVLAGFSADVVWDSRYPAHVPIAGEFKGHEGIGKLVAAIGASLELVEYEPREVIAEGEKVMVVGWEKVVAKPTGRTYTNMWVHQWTVRDEKVVFVRSFNDTASVGEAFRTG